MGEEAVEVETEAECLREQEEVDTLPEEGKVVNSKDMSQEPRT